MDHVVKKEAGNWTWGATNPSTKDKQTLTCKIYRTRLDNVGHVLRSVHDNNSFSYKYIRKKPINTNYVQCKKQHNQSNTKLLSL